MPHPAAETYAVTAESYHSRLYLLLIELLIIVSGRLVMGVDDEASELLDVAVRDEQVAYRVPHERVPALRSAVRRLARERGLRIRTGMADGVLVVILAYAALWDEPVSTMREKLTPQQDSEND